MNIELFFKLLSLSPFRFHKEQEILFINAQSNTHLQKTALCYQPKRGQFVKLKEQGFEVLNEFPARLFDLILIYPSNSASENYAHFGKSLELLKPGGICLSAFTNNLGAKRFEEKLALLYQNINSESKNKSRIFWAERSDFYDKDLLAQWLLLSEARAFEHSELYTTAGIFSEDSPDTASLLLCKHLNDLKGTVLDLGCGNGLLAKTLIKLNSGITELHLAEHDWRALQLARKALPEEKFQFCKFHWWDISENTLPQADAIISNPPYHSNFGLDLSLLYNFIDKAFTLLKKGGVFRFVTQKTYKTEAHLPDVFKRSQILAEDDCFRVYEVKK